MVNKVFKNRVFLFIGVLFINILLLGFLDLVEVFLNLKKPKIDNKEDILNNIIFYSIFLIIITPLLEEILYRLPLKKKASIFFSLLIGFFYVMIFDLLLIKIIIGLYLILIFYLWYFEKKISKLVIIISLFVFVISHIGNYYLEDIKLMNFLELIFLFAPQIILGIIVTFFRIKFSFNYALLYHMMYNFIIILLAINFDK